MQGSSLGGTHPIAEDAQFPGRNFHHVLSVFGRSKDGQHSISEMNNEQGGILYIYHPHPQGHGPLDAQSGACCRRRRVRHVRSMPQRRLSLTKTWHAFLLEALSTIPASNRGIQSGHSALCGTYEETERLRQRELQYIPGAPWCKKSMPFTPSRFTMLNFCLATALPAVRESNWPLNRYTGEELGKCHLYMTGHHRRTMQNFTASQLHQAFNIPRGTQGTLLPYYMALV